jgi:RNA polymerase sigma-70 factor, ECF subfamily
MASKGLVATLSSSPFSPAVDGVPARDLAVMELFDLHAPGLYRLAVAMLRDADGAQDVVQDTFLRLMKHVDAGGRLPNAKGWLYTVAANTCRDRRRGGWRWLPWLPELDQRASPDPTDAGDRHAAILDALHAVRPRDRLLIALRAQGLTYQDIAAAAGIRPASVGRLLARALDRLAREMGMRQEVLK